MSVKIATYAKTHASNADDKSIIEEIKKALIKSLRRSFAGRKPIRPIISNSGFSDMDFIRKEYTIIAYAYTVRVPRILLPPVSRHRNRNPYKINRFCKS